MLVYTKIALLIVAAFLNFRSPKLMILTVIIGVDIFLPIPSDAGRVTWCVDCIFVDFITGFLVLFFETEVSCALCLICLGLVPIHSIYMQYGSAKFPEYRSIVPVMECMMLFFCIIGGLSYTHPEHKITSIIRKHFWWVFFNTNLKLK
jgi:hypothetical protein